MSSFETFVNFSQRFISGIRAFSSLVIEAMNTQVLGFSLFEIIFGAGIAVYLSFAVAKFVAS